MGVVVTVRDVMTRDIVAVEKTDPVIKAIDLMVKREIGSVVVTERGNPVGILTERDIMKRVCPQELCSRKVTVGEVMSQPLVTIEAEARFGEAAMLMLEKNIRRLIVVDEGKVVGIITQGDIMRGTLDTFMALSMIR